MAEHSIRDELVQVLAKKRMHTNESLGKQGADADAILASPVIRRLQAEAIREYGKALAENRSAFYWDLGDFLYDIEDWAKEIEQ